MKNTFMNGKSYMRNSYIRFTEKGESASYSSTVDCLEEVAVKGAKPKYRTLLYKHLTVFFINLFLCASTTLLADVMYVDWNNGFLTTEDTLIWPDVQLSEISSFAGEMRGGFGYATITNSLGQSSRANFFADGIWVKDEEGGRTVQFYCKDGSTYTNFHEK